MPQNLLESARDSAILRFHDGKTIKMIRRRNVYWIEASKLAPDESRGRLALCGVEDISMDVSPVHSVELPGEVSLEAKMKSVAVNLCLVDRLPWEKLCYGADAKVAGVPEAVRIPESLLVKV